MLIAAKPVRFAWSRWQGLLSPLLASFALGVPLLFAPHLPLHYTLLNVATALLGWGVWMAWLTASVPTVMAARSGGLNALHAAVAALAGCAVAAPLWAGLPWSIALASLGVLAAAALAAQAGAALACAGRAAEVFKAFCAGLVVAAALSSVVGIVQVFAPDLADGRWIAVTNAPGRASGNIRQSNHLSSLLAWGIVAAVWLGEVKALGRRASSALALLFLAGIVLSVSRTGAACVLLLTGWGIIDRRLSRPARLLLVLLPLFYAVFWWVASAAAGFAKLPFGGDTRFAHSGGVLESAGRWGLWRNAYALIATQPWAGVGWGELNFAWTLSEFGERPQAYFTHAHNFFIHLAVENGVPMMLLVSALLARALFAVLSSAVGVHSGHARSGHARPALAILVVILFHSMLELPLWHFHFLVPASFVLGLCLAIPGPERAPPEVTMPVDGRQPVRPLFVGALMMAMAGPLAVQSFLPVAAIAAAPGDPPASAESVARARGSLLFSHIADTALASRPPPVAARLPYFERGAHDFIDADLLQSWAMALNDAGETDRARFLAQRLREFHLFSAPFFAPCKLPANATGARPFQCQPPEHTYGFEDFRGNRAVRAEGRSGTAFN